MPEFNLVDREWIPCLMRNDEQPRELSLRNVLLEAHNIREVFDDSPLVTVALHRLLLAILHRNFGPASFNEWKELWKRGKWDGDVIAKYLDQWRHRLDLFDEARPFYQVPRLQKAVKGRKAGKKADQSPAEDEDVDLHPVALLAHEAASGNNATLFDHNFKDVPTAYSPAAAARYLVAHQAFSLGGGVSTPFNLYHAPLVRGFSVLALGDSLFETLALNMLLYTEERPIPHLGKDLPAWENNNPEEPDKTGTFAHGYLDYLTWQSRRIHLVAPEDESAGVLFCQRLQNLRLSDEHLRLDPFKCYFVGEEEGLQPRPVNPNKALWRDSHVLFQQVDQSKRRPETFNFLARVETTRRRGEIEAKPAYSLAVFGFATEPPPKAASVMLWSHERLPLPLVYLTEPQLAESVRLALKLADEIHKHLRESIRLMAKLLIAPLSNDPQARQPKPKEVNDRAKEFGSEEFYWARLEPAFKKLLTDLPQDQRANQVAEDLPDTQATTEWARVLLETARAAVSKTINGLSGSARELKAGAEAERRFNGLMSQIRKAHPRLFPPKPETGGEA